MTTVAEAITEIRASKRALRAIAKNGGRTLATERAVTRHEMSVNREQFHLVRSGHKELVGLLVEEGQLLERLGVAAKVRRDRPELAVRARRIAADIRRYAKLNGSLELGLISAHRPTSTVSRPNTDRWGTSWSGNA